MITAQVSTYTTSKEIETLLTWDANSIRRWEITSGKELPALTGHAGGVKGASLLPDGSILSWKNDELMILDPRTGKENSKISGRISGLNMHMGWGSSRYCVLPNGNAVLESEKAHVLWDILRGQPIATLPGHRLMDWSDDRIITAKTPRSCQVEVYASDAKTGALLATMTGVYDSTFESKLLANNNVLTWSYDKLWHLYAAETGALIASGKKGIDGVLPIKNCYGQVLMWGSANTAPMVLGSTGKKVTTLSAADGNSTIRNAFSMEDGSIITVSKEGFLYYYPPEVKPEKEQGFKSGLRLKGSPKDVHEVVISPQGRILGTYGYKSILLWNSPYAEPSVLEQDKYYQWCCFLSEKYLLTNTTPPSIFDTTGKAISTLENDSAVEGCLVI